jgi:hypothetical protein
MGWAEVGTWIQTLLVDQAGFEVDAADSITSHIVPEADANVAMQLVQPLRHWPHIERPVDLAGGGPKERTCESACRRVGRSVSSILMGRSGKRFSLHPAFFADGIHP